MQSKLSEQQSVKDINQWISAWPLIIFLTFFVGVYFLERMWIDFNICYRNYSSICEYSSIISNAIASLIAGLWSLVFLKYINNKNTAFVRKHGLEALKFSGLCTGILLGGVALDFLGSINAFIYIAILIILVLWYLQTKNGAEKIKEEFEETSESNSVEVLNLPSNQTIEQTARPIEDILLISITALYALASPLILIMSAMMLSAVGENGDSAGYLGCIIPIVLIGALVMAWRENKKNNKTGAIIISLLPAVLFIFFL